MSFLKEKPRIIPMVMRGCCCSIIPYQEIIGNYSELNKVWQSLRIIPYQEIIGNYSEIITLIQQQQIIPYQEIIGNYSIGSRNSLSTDIIPYQEIIGNYSGMYEALESKVLYHTKK